ncbi:MAG: hypothetical protein HRT35_13280 [Algicola sp.]|nr:hypothetical protein [Algicola sp.]
MEIWKKAITLLIESVVVNEQMVCFFITDGRSISVSLSSVPELVGGAHDAIRNCQIADDSEAVFWPDFNKTIKLSDFLRD